MSKEKCFILNEAIDYLDNLEVLAAEVPYIQSPENANNGNSDIDSGDWNEPTPETSVLNSNQLLGSAVGQINTPSRQVIRGAEQELCAKAPPFVKHRQNL